MAKTLKVDEQEQDDHRRACTQGQGSMARDAHNHKDEAKDTRDGGKHPWIISSET
jgi:hypothetical protein